MNKILIVKLGAMGDVLRTTPLLRAYKKLFPKAHITWVVDQTSQVVLKGNTSIDDLRAYSEETLARLKTERYELALNLDKEPEALDTIAAAKAMIKMGFGWNVAKDAVAALNESSAYALRLGVDDELKFRTNQKTYQEISFEQLGLEFKGEEYLFSVNTQDRITIEKHLATFPFAKHDLKRAVGINTGSGDRFAGKRLPEKTVVALARRLATELKVPVLLLGGPEEHERNRRLEKLCAPFARSAGTHHSIGEFAALVSQLALVITGDTIAMHIAIATKVPALVYFGSTSAPEIELYGRGKKIISKLECAPCYKRTCPIDEQCMRDVSIDDLWEQTKEILCAHKASNVS